MSKEAKLQHDEKVTEVLHYFEKIREGIPEGLLETLAKGLVAQLEQIDRQYGTLPRPPAMRGLPSSEGHPDANQTETWNRPTGYWEEKKRTRQGHYGIGDVD